MEHPEAEKLYRSLTANGHSDVAEKIARETELPLDADAKMREKWLKHALGEIERSLADDTVKKVRKGCICSLEAETRVPGYKEIYDRTKARKERYKKLYEESRSLEEFVAEVKRLEDEPEKPSIELVDGKLYKYYYFCPCPFLQESSALVPRSWCYCTLGYNEDLYSYVFNRKVRGRLMGAIKLGVSRCAIELEL
ncbi:MAG: DUF6144 family protein [bacterium]|nr:DUF6144 family protein [bacterium]